MDKLKLFVSNLWEEFGGPIVVAVCVVGFIALLVAGYSFLTTLVLIFVLALAAWKALPLLIHSIFIAALLKTLSGTLKSFSGVWFAGAGHDKFYAAVDATSLVTMVMLLFLLVYVVKCLMDVITTILGSPHFAHITMNVESKSGK